MAKAPQKSKDAKAKAASGGGKKSKKKWSKGKVRLNF
jgi:ribosomal protein S25